MKGNDVKLTLGEVAGWCFATRAREGESFEQLSRELSWNADTLDWSAFWDGANLALEVEEGRI